jgi:hypothetical protein
MAKVKHRKYGRRSQATINLMKKWRKERNHILTTIFPELVHVPRSIEVRPLQIRREIQ